MVAEVNRSIMHSVHIVQGVSNAYCAIRSMVQRFSCINDGVATEPASATPVIIEDDVLVGANAVVIEGVHVGKNAVVVAGAVVIDDVPENAVVAGCPARIIKMKDDKAAQKTKLEDALRNL